METIEHLIPLADAQTHVTSVECWCIPAEAEPGLWIHNAKLSEDCRRQKFVSENSRGWELIGQRTTQTERELAEAKEAISGMQARADCQTEVDRCLRNEIATLVQELADEKSKHNETRKELSVTMMQLAGAIEELKQHCANCSARIAEGVNTNEEHKRRT